MDRYDDIDLDDPLGLLDIQDNVRESLEILENKSFGDELKRIPDDMYYRLSEETREKLKLVREFRKREAIDNNNKMIKSVKDFLKQSEEKLKPLRRDRNLRDLLD